MEGEAGQGAGTEALVGGADVHGRWGVGVGMVVGGGEGTGVVEWVGRGSKRVHPIQLVGFLWSFGKSATDHGTMIQ